MDVLAKLMDFMPSKFNTLKANNRGRGPIYIYWARFFASAIVSTHITKCIRNVLHIYGRLHYIQEMVTATTGLLYEKVF